MKWRQKGYELDNFAKELIDEFAKRKKIFIFGAGLLGEEFSRTLEKFGLFGGFIDNSAEKQREGVRGRRVYSIDEYKKAENGWIVIATNSMNAESIEKQLAENGLQRNNDFFHLNYFTERIFPVLLLYRFNTLYVDLSQICLTERCTLKCKKCAHACYAVKATKKDLSLEQVKSSADYYFKIVDYVREFVLIGGEPLLYQNMIEAVEYIGSHYREQIEFFSITTNGTIKPSQELLDVCRKYKMTFRISNYSVQIPRLRKQYMELVETLEKNHIHYVLASPEVEWMDYGFEDMKRNATSEQLEGIFDACETPCREVRENRFYYCVMARSVAENLNYNIGEDDYLNLEELLANKNKKKIFMEYCLGYSEKGYLDMCDCCRGAEAVNYVIPAAEQL